MDLLGKIGCTAAVFLVLFGIGVWIITEIDPAGKRDDWLAKVVVYGFCLCAVTVVLDLALIVLITIWSS